jgi:chaperonin GroES
MAITPLNDRVLVQRIASEEKSAGGIIIPDSAKEKPQEGKVVAVGPGKTNEKGDRVAPSLSTGDRVLFGKYGGTEVSHGGQDYVLLREDEILATIAD